MLILKRHDFLLKLTIATQDAYEIFFKNSELGENTIGMVVNKRTIFGIGSGEMQCLKQEKTNVKVFFVGNK